MRRYGLKFGFWVLGFTFWFLVAIFLPLLPHALSADDDADLKAVVEKFFAAYAKEDLDSFMGLWSAKSPDYASRKRTMQQFFTSGDDYTFTNLAVSRIKIEGEKANLRAVIDLTALNPQKQRIRKERLARHFDFVKEDGVWKVWRYYPPLVEFQTLATALITAKTDEERTSLLREQRELVTADFVLILGAQGNPFYQRGDYPQALRIYQLALSVAQQIEDPVGIAEALSSIGNIHQEQGNYEEALRYAQQGRSRFEALEDSGRAATAWNNVGVIYEKQGNYAKAVEAYQKSLSLRDAKENVNVLVNMGNVLTRQGNYTQALDYYQRSLKQFEASGDEIHKNVTLNNIAVVYSLQKKYPEALEFYQQSLRLSNTLGDQSGTATALNNIGLVHALQKEYQQALKYYEQSLSKNQSLKDKVLEASILNNIGMLQLAQGNSTQALDAADRATALANRLGNPEILWKARTIAGQAYALKQPAESSQAHQAFQDAISHIEKMRTRVAGSEQEQQRFFESKVDPYHGLIDLLISQSKHAGAFFYAERAKARVLLDVLQKNRVDITRHMTAEEQAKERKLKDALVSLNTQILRERDDTRLADLNNRLVKARQDYETFLRTLYVAHPNLKVQRGEAKPLTLEEARSLIPDPKAGLLEFVVMEEESYLFVITQEAKPKTQTPKAALRIYSLNVKREQLEERVRQFHTRLSLKGEVEDARGLYDLLLKPAQAQLRGKTTLCIVPDGPLWELPFQVLQPKENRYLLEDCALFYAPSLTALREMMKLRNQPSREKKSPLTLLAFGNPTLGQETTPRTEPPRLNGDLSPLPQAEALVRSLEQLYGTARSKVYVGTDASEKRLKAMAGNAEIIQLATHARLDDVSPLYSHVLLSQSEGDTKEDGLLEAWEMMRLNLKANMVVLSACETARGHVGAGEGVIGMTWALFVAGCPTTVASQWEVRADSTTQLMLEFHRNLKSKIPNPQSPFPTAKSLQLAALKVMQSGGEFRHPFHWAGFVLVGDGR